MLSAYHKKRIRRARAVYRSNPDKTRDVEAALRANPAKSNRAIAAITGTTQQSRFPAIVQRGQKFDGSGPKQQKERSYQQDLDEKASLPVTDVPIERFEGPDGKADGGNPEERANNNSFVTLSDDKYFINNNLYRSIRERSDES